MTDYWIDISDVFYNVAKIN